MSNETSLTRSTEAMRQGLRDTYGANTIAYCNLQLAAFRDRLDEIEARQRRRVQLRPRMGQPGVARGVPASARRRRHGVQRRR
jgi:hypothetical protein